MFKNILIRRSLWMMLILGGMFAFVMYLLSGAGPAGQNGFLYMQYYGGACAIYWLAVLYVHRFWGRTFLSVEIIVIFALMVRVMFVLQNPSPGISRHVWDGKVSNIGVNPYAYTPEAPFLRGLQDSEAYLHLTGKNSYSPNAPLLQILSAAIVYFTESPWAFKILFALMDVALILLIMAMLRHFDRAIAWVTVYAWNPLVIMEISGKGSGVILPVFFLLLGIYLALKCRPIWAALPLAFASGFNIVWAFAATFFEDAKSRWKISLTTWFVIAVMVLILYAVYQDTMIPVFHYVHEPFTREYNGGLYRLIHLGLSQAISNGSGAVYAGGFRFSGNVSFWSVLSCAGIIIFLWVILTVRFMKKSFTEQKQKILYFVYGYMSAYLLCSPVWSPELAMVMIPMLCFYPHPAWIYLTGALGLAGIWDSVNSGLPLWTIEYIPFYLIGLVSVIRFLYKRKKTFHHLEQPA